MAKGITEIIEDFKVLHPMAYKRIRKETIDECITELNDYIEFPMTDEYVIKECITVLEQLKEKK